MGWLKFTPSTEVEQALGELVESLRAGTLDMEWDDQGVSRDRRSCPADSEELAESGLDEVILLMRPALEAEGMRLRTGHTSFERVTAKHYADSEALDAARLAARDLVAIASDSVSTDEGSC